MSIGSSVNGIWSLEFHVSNVNKCDIFWKVFLRLPQRHGFVPRNHWRRMMSWNSVNFGSSNVLVPSDPICYSVVFAIFTHSIHYSYVIMSPMASQITGVSVVCSIFCSGADKKKHQSSASLAFVRGVHRWPMNSPHKLPVTREMFPFDGVVMAEGNAMLLSPHAWVNYSTWKHRTDDFSVTNRIRWKYLFAYISCLMMWLLQNGVNTTTSRFLSICNFLWTDFQEKQHNFCWIWTMCDTPLLKWAFDFSWRPSYQATWCCQFYSCVISIDNTQLITKIWYDLNYRDITWKSRRLKSSATQLWIHQFPTQRQATWKVILCFISLSYTDNRLFNEYLLPLGKRKLGNFDNIHHSPKCISITNLRYVNTKQT